MKRYLSGYGDCDIAVNGNEAVEMAGKDKPCVMILDIGLPDLSGVHVIKKVRDCSPNTKIIVTTGYRSDELEEEVMFRGRRLSPG